MTRAQLTQSGGKSGSGNQYVCVPVSYTYPINNALHQCWQWNEAQCTKGSTRFFFNFHWSCCTVVCLLCSLLFQPWVALPLHRLMLEWDNSGHQHQHSIILVYRYTSTFHNVIDFEVWTSSSLKTWRDSAYGMWVGHTECISNRADVNVMQHYRIFLSWDWTTNKVTYCSCWLFTSVIQWYDEG